MAFSFYCRNSKVDRYGYAPIELSIIVGGKRVFINLPRKELPSVFKKSIKATKANPVKEYLSVQMNCVNSAIHTITSLGKPLTADALREYLKYGGVKLYTVKNLFEDYLKILELRCTYDNLRKYMVIRDEFYAFVEDIEKPLEEVTNADIQSFCALEYKKYKSSTAFGKINKLKSVFRFAFDNNKISVNIFSGIRIHKEKPKVEYLTEQEVKILIDKHFDIDRLEKVKDLFLFQCGSGLAFSDMASLRPCDIKVEGSTVYIKKTRQKTDIEYTSVLLPFAVDILEKYQYQLPTISNQKMNSYLGEIEVLCRISKNLHSHLGRKTYATLLLNKGVNISVVAKCLGHANTNITQSVYAHLQTGTILHSISEVFEPSLK